MAKVSYIITLNDDLSNIDRLFCSIKTIAGHFRKEFFVINKISAPGSYELIRKHTSNIPNLSVIVANQGSCLPLNIFQGEYLKFISENEIVTPMSTELLMNSLHKNDAGLAYGVKKHLKNLENDTSTLISNAKLVDDPLTILLRKQDSNMKWIGTASTLFTRKLIEDVSEKNKIMSPTSLTLLCAAKSNFVFCPDAITYFSNNKSSFKNNYQNICYENLLALKKLIEFDEQTAEKYSKQIRSAIVRDVWKTKKNLSTIQLFLSNFLPNKISSNKNMKEFIDFSIKKFF